MVLSTALVGLLVVAAGALATSGVAGGGDVRVDGAERLAALPEYGARGSEVVGYTHDAEVTVGFTLVNRGIVPLTVLAVDPFPVRLGLLRAVDMRLAGGSLPATLGPRQAAEVTVAARFDNCEYFTERAINEFGHAAVTWRVAGMERVSEVAYDHELLVRSPAIVGCPDRVLDRSAKQRGASGTITGRG